jgi:hypothetical protein
LLALVAPGVCQQQLRDHDLPCLLLQQRILQHQKWQFATDLAIAWRQQLLSYWDVSALAFSSQMQWLAHCQRL